MLERYYESSYVGSDTTGRYGLFFCGFLVVRRIGGGCVIGSDSSLVIFGQFLFIFELFQFKVDAVGGRFARVCVERFVGGGVF